MSSDGKYENQSIIVVSRNERTVAVSKDVLGDNIEFKGAMPIHVDEKYNYYLKTDIQYTSDTNPEMASIGDVVIPSEYRQSHRGGEVGGRGVVGQGRGRGGGVRLGVGGEIMYIKLDLKTNPLGTNSRTHF